MYTGDQVGWNMARGVKGAYGKQANYWWVWLPLSLAFAAAFWRTDRLLSVRNLDIVALLGFLVSHGFYRQGIVFEAVVLWYPPLVYLFVRTLLMGFGIGERVEKTSNLPMWLLMVLAGLAGGLILSLNVDSRVIDVGYAGVVGADRILDGTIPYGNMPADVGTGDTYGPLNYLLYVPFVLMFGFSGEWDFLPAAHALTLFSFVAGAMALFITGYRLSGREGAAALIFAWTAFPYTVYATNNNTNDIIVAAVAAIGLAAAASPIARGASIAAGFAVKLYPLVLGPLWISYDGFKRKPIVDFVLGGAGVVLLTFWVVLLDGHPFEAIKLFYQKTLAFQGDRVSPWTIYTQVPRLAFLQKPITALVIFIAILVAFVPRKKTLRRLAALSAALVIAFQLTVNYWFYAYIIWFEPFVFVALLLSTNEKTALDGRHQASGIRHQEVRRSRAEMGDGRVERPILNIEGELVALGPLRRDLLPLYQRWINNLRTTRTLDLPPYPMTVEKEQDWYDQHSRAENDVPFTIYERKTLRPIGNTGLHGVDYRTRTATFGIIIGEPECRGKGYGTETTRLMLDYAFTALGSAQRHADRLRVQSRGHHGLSEGRLQGDRPAPRVPPDGRQALG